jgi:DNA-binding CsgD family transcriptional regulator
MWKPTIFSSGKVERLSTEAERLQWRRNKVLELSSQGRSQPEIAKVLQVGLGTVNRDLQYLRQKAKQNIRRYIDERLPLEYQKCLIGLDNILSKIWDIANNQESLERDKLQAVSVGMQAYGMKIDLLSSATVVERAVQFVENHRSDKPLSSMQNDKARIDVP